MSSLGSTLWNIVIKGWFQKLEEANEEWIAAIEEEREIERQHVQDLVHIQADTREHVVNGAPRAIRRTMWARQR